MLNMFSRNESRLNSPQTELFDPSTTIGPAGAAKRTRHSQRKRLACRRCQARKIKCDGLLPKCSACQRAYTECVDGKTTGLGPTISKKEALKLREENRRLLQIVRERCPDIDTTTTTEFDPQMSNTIAAAEDSPNDPSRPYIQSRNRPLSSHDAVRTGNTPRTLQTSSTPPGELTESHTPGDIAHEIGMIPLSAGVNKYVGSSSGFSIAKLVLARADRAAGYSLGAQQTNEATAEIRFRSMFMISPSALPTSQEQAIQLSRIYFEQVHPRYPFLHQQSYFRLLNAVYDGSSTVTRSAKFQVTMVLAISATILSKRLRIPFSGEGLCAAAMEYADDIDFQSSTEGVQCLLLISMFTLHNPFLGINPWYLNYQCLAAVLDLGLQQGMPRGSPANQFEREMRTRVFWVVFSIDRIIATTLGRPVGLRDESCDLRLPEGFEDDQLDALNAQSESQPSASTSNHPGPISCAIIHFRLSLLNSEIMYTLHNVSPNAPQHTYPRVPDVEAWQLGLYGRLMAIRKDFPEFGSHNGHLLALCEIRYHEINMLLFRPTPRIRSPSKDSLTHCYQSAAATVQLWKELYNSDRMSYSWTSIHSISLSAIIILYCIWMVRELATAIDIDALTQTMMTASNLLSAAGEHWADARRCRNSLNNLTAATIRWLISIRSAQPQSGITTTGDRGNQVECSTQTMNVADRTVNAICPDSHQPRAYLNNSEGLEVSDYDTGYPWVDTYINEEDLASLFRGPDFPTADHSLTVEEMFSDYQPLFDFYQGNESGI